MTDGARRLAGTLALAVLAAPSCRRTKSAGPLTKPVASATPPAEHPSPPTVKPIETLSWSTVKDTSPYGLPVGCVLRSARSAKLPPGTTRFTAPSGSAAELVLAEDENGDGTVERAAVLHADGRPGSAVPWTAIDAPPLFAESAAGVVAVDRVALDEGRYRVELWRQPGSARTIAEGDALDAMDVLCDGSICALLTTVASASAGPGATLFVGDPARPAPFQRVDIAGEEEGWTPLSIAKLEGSVAWVALSGKDSVSIVRVENGKTSSVARLGAAFGVYDVAGGDAPFAIEPGESPPTECTRDSFPMKFVTPGTEAKPLDVQVPPEGLATRRLAEGFFVAWLAPVSCRHKTREMVRALLSGPEGSPESSTMAVAAAEGFAVAASGSRVNLWLSVDGDLVRLESECRPARSR